MRCVLVSIVYKRRLIDNTLEQMNCRSAGGKMRRLEIGLTISQHKYVATKENNNIHDSLRALLRD